MLESGVEHYTVVGLVSWPVSFSYGNFALKNTSKRKSNKIYITMQERWYRNKVNSSLVFACKRGYSPLTGLKSI